MELWTALLLGLLGGLHCAGMCGPLMLALPVVGSSPARFLAGRLVYQLGRVLTYGGLGVVSGLLGRGLVAAGVGRWVSIALGAALLAGLWGSPRWLEAAWLTRLVAQLKRSMGVYLRTRTMPALATLGLLNGLLPCGLVYAACAGAAAAGSLRAGVEYMLVFGLGTTPMMLGISLSGRLLPGTVRLRLRHLVPFGVAAVGCLLILRGLSLGIPYLSPDLSGATPACCHP